MQTLDPLLARTLVLVAHPDDESLGCGALLQRMAAPLVVFATDGAPKVAKWWKPYGSRAALAKTRISEGKKAVHAGGIERVEFLAEHDAVFADQEIFRHLARAEEILLQIAASFGPQAVLTHAYEGGHPDHDACSVLAYVLGKKLKIPVWEMPFYHRAGREEILRQRFLTRSRREVLFLPTPAELFRKRRMLAAHVSQRKVIDQFDLAQERFRPQPRYNYGAPPHEGRVNYEAWQWRMTARQVSRAFANFLRANGRPGEGRKKGRTTPRKKGSAAARPVKPQAASRTRRNP